MLCSVPGHSCYVLRAMFAYANPVLMLSRHVVEASRRPPAHSPRNSRDVTAHLAPPGEGRAAGDEAVGTVEEDSISARVNDAVSPRELVKGAKLDEHARRPRGESTLQEPAVPGETTQAKREEQELHNKRLEELAARLRLLDTPPARKSKVSLIRSFSRCLDAVSCHMKQRLSLTLRMTSTGAPPPNHNPFPFPRPDHCAHTYMH